MSASDHDELEEDELEDAEDDDLEDEEEKLDDEDDDEVEASDDPDQIADTPDQAAPDADVDALCPECDAEIEQEIKRGNSVTCPGCSCKLEVLEIHPVRLIVAEELEGDEEGHSRRAPTASPKEDPSANQPKRIPGTRSVALGVVPSADPEAPYGRDENDKALVPMRPDQDIAVDLRERRPDLAPGACPHKNDPNNCILCGTKKIRPRQEPPKQSLSNQRDLRQPATQEQLKSEHHDQLEENTRRIFKTPKPLVRNTRASAAFSSLFDANKSVATPLPEKLNLKFDCYRDLIGIERETIAVLFDYIVGWIRPEKPAEGAIEQLQTEIAELEALILTRSAAWQKRHRPADRLEKNDRERLKRQETGLRNKKKAELSQVRARLRHWQDTPPIAVTFGERYNITHRNVSTETKFIPDILRTPAGQDPYYTEPLAFVDTYHGGEYNIEGYRQLLKLGSDAIALTTDGMTFSGWVEWENKVILQAIKIGLLTPNVDRLKKHPGLGVYCPADKIDIDSTAENLLIIKTGGAEINGNIRGAGYRGKSNNTRRSLRDFNIPLKGGGADGPESHPTDASDQDESYTPD